MSVAMAQNPTEYTISESDRAFLEENGYVRIANALDPSRCENIIKYIWTLMPDRFNRADPASWTGRVQDCCNNLPLYQNRGLVRFKDKHGFAKVPVFKDAIYDNAHLLGVIAAALGRSLERVRVRGLHPNFPIPAWVPVNEVMGNRIHDQMSGPALQFLKIPRPPQLPITPHLDAHPFELSSMLYLEDVEDEAGGLAVWPGSHRLFAHAFEAEFNFLPTLAYKRLLSLLQRFRPRTLGGKKGDLIIFHNRLLHSNTFNFSNQIRYGLLIDIFGTGWNERDEAWRQKQDEDLRARMCSKEEFKNVELVRSIVETYEPDAVSTFFMDHPRLRSFLTRMQKDPVGSFRRKLSAKIRSRAEGDVWLVVSQGGEHKSSFKLDAYGSKEGGNFRVEVNDARQLQSEAGALVEKIELAPGLNRIRLKGDMKVPHYLRVVRTANPVETSEILTTATIAGGATQIEIEFDAQPHAERPTSARPASEAVAAIAG